MSRPDKKTLTREQYEKGVKSGEFLHVFDEKNKEVVVIQRDGYYSPDRAKDFVNLERYRPQDASVLFNLLSKITK